MIQVCCTTGLAMRRTQVNEIAVSSRLSRRALIINQTHRRFPCWTTKPMTSLQTLHCAYSVENILLKKTENSTKSKQPNAFKMWKTQQKDRMLLHAIHADKVFAESGVKGRIIIKSPDTDVLVLCVHYFSKLQHTQELWFQTGTVSSTKDRRRYIPVQENCSTLWQTRFTTHNKSFTKHCGLTSPPLILHLLFNTLISYIPVPWNYFPLNYFHPMFIN